jgi:hypothetical protein
MAPAAPAAAAAGGLLIGVDEALGAPIVAPDKPAKAPPCYVDARGDPPGLSPLALAACVSAAHPDGFKGCGGGAIDHDLGDFLESHGVQHCTGADATALTCPEPQLPNCPAGPVVKARAGSFTLLRENSTIKAQIMQGPVVAAFKCPASFVKFGSAPMPYAVGQGAYGGWHKVRGSAPWTHAFAWHGPSDNGHAGHAITLIGFIEVEIDDPKAPGQTIQVEAWVARNSFGLEWGDRAEVDAQHKGYLLFVSTSSGYNGTLGIGSCNDSVEICSNAFECGNGSCRTGASTHTRTNKNLTLVPNIFCDGCRRESVGAAVFDAEVGPGKCGAGDFHVVKKTCDGNGGGEIHRRCDKWPAEQPDIILPCANHFYIGDNESGTKLRRNEHDVRKTAVSGVEGGATKADGSGADGSGADGSGADGSGADGSGADGSGADGSGADGSGARPARPVRKLSSTQLALAIVLPITIAALGGTVAALVVCGRRVPAQRVNLPRKN